MDASKSTMALAPFAATSMRQDCRPRCGRSSAGCCSITCASARLARGCRGAAGRAAMSAWSARRGLRMCCSRRTPSIRSTRPSSTSPSARASMPTTPMSAPCCIPASRPGRRRSRSPSTPARRGRRCWPRSSPATRPSSASDLRCSPAISSAASRAPAPATGSAPRRRRGGCCFAAPMPRADRRRARARRRLRQRPRAVLLFRRLGQAHPGRARRRGRRRRRAARRGGLRGPRDIIEGQGGFARAYADGWNPAVIEDGLGQRFHLMDVLVKSHAAAARVAAGIDAMLALRQQHEFAIDDIASMALGIPRIIQGRLTNPHPVDLQAAQMCLPFSVALASKFALAPGRIATSAVADYEAGLEDRSLHAIEERTTIALDDEVEAASNELSTAARVSVRCATGASSPGSCRRRRAARPSPSPARSTRRASSRSCRAACRRKSAARSSRCRAISIGSIRAGSGGY